MQTCRVEDIRKLKAEDGPEAAALEKWQVVSRDRQAGSIQTSVIQAGCKRRKASVDEETKADTWAAIVCAVCSQHSHP